MELRKPTQSNASLEEAYQQALETREPVFVPTSYFADDRGYSLMNQLLGVLSPDGQVNYSTQYPGVIKAWHRHQDQTDFWMCLRGHIKVGVHDESSNASWVKVIGEKCPGTMIIPPPLWHGAATVGNEPAGLLYYVTKRFNPASPDEDRRDHDSVAGFPWNVQHG
ncbi:MAG: cupin domain-containing protein [Planctomycetota bacterium]|jgi:dTDP-4-dehydrorhamnose 3,5-epimerase